jgi:hypothetical protein
MQDPGYELPRIPIPRTRVNKADKEGRGCVISPALLRARQLRLLLLGNLLGRHPRFFWVCCPSEELPATLVLPSPLPYNPLYE